MNQFVNVYCKVQHAWHFAHQKNRFICLYVAANCQGPHMCLHRVHMWERFDKDFVKLQVLGLRLGVDFTFFLDNNHNNHNNNDNDNNNPHLNFFKGTVQGVKEQGLGIRDKG